MAGSAKAFEIIVMGGGLAGLIAAAFLAKGGRSLLLLKERRCRPYYERNGYRFLLFSTLLDETVPAALLRKISHFLQGSGIQKAEAKQKGSISFQILLPEVRIDLHQDRFLLEREWCRAFPGEVGSIKALYEEFDRTEQDPFPICSPSFFNRGWVLNLLKKEKKIDLLAVGSKEFKTFMGLQALLRSYLYLDSYPIPLLAYLIGDGGASPRESVDFGRLEQNLIQTLLQNGGLIKEVEGVERVEAKWGGGLRVYLKEETDPLRCQYIVINGSVHSLSNLFGEKRDPLLKWKKRIQPLYRVIPFCVGLREKVIPVGMGNRLISLYDLDKPPDGGNLLFLRLDRGPGESSAPEGRVGLTVEALMPYEALLKSNLSRLEESVMAHLTYLFPFLEGYMEFIDHQWAVEQVGCWSYPHYLYGKPSGFRWRKWVVPIKISRGIYVSGRENYPQLGMEGEILSGLQVAEEILKRFR